MKGSYTMTRNGGAAEIRARLTLQRYTCTRCGEQVYARSDRAFRRIHTKKCKWRK